MTMQSGALAVNPQEILDLLPVNVYWKDLHGRYLGFNQSMLKTLGVTSAEFVGRTDCELWGPEVAHELAALEQTVMQERSRSELKEQGILGIFHKQRTYFSIRVPLYNTVGEVSGVLGTYLEVTESPAAEQLKLETLQVFANALAHEIRTPMTAVTLNADNLRTALAEYHVLHSVDLKSQAKSQAWLQSCINDILLAVRNSSLLLEITLVNIRGLLGVVKVEEHQLLVHSIKASISEALVAYPFYNRLLSLVHWDPATAEDFTYKGYAPWFKYLCFNLIKNALWAIKEADQGELWIRIERDQHENRVIFQDTAGGIKPEIFSQLFARFKNCRRTSLGLGLAFCKKAMHSWGGELLAETTVGKGTKFTLIFPQQEAASL